MTNHFYWILLNILMWISLAFIPFGFLIMYIKWESEAPFWLIPSSAMCLSIVLILSCLEVRDRFLDDSFPSDL